MKEACVKRYRNSAAAVAVERARKASAKSGRKHPLLKLSAYRAAAASVALKRAGEMLSAPARRAAKASAGASGEASSAPRAESERNAGYGEIITTADA